MKFIQNAFDRITKHWQSSLIGVIVGVLTFMLYKRDISVTEWGMAIGSVLTLKGIFINKDPDKTANKPDQP